MPWGNESLRLHIMVEYHFRLLVRGKFEAPIADETLLDFTDKLGEAGCDDCTISVRGEDMELEFAREEQSLHVALFSAIRDVEQAGFVVQAVEMDRDAVFATTPDTAF